MRKLTIAAASALALFAVTGTPAVAGEPNCKPALSAKGATEHSMRDAIEAAKYAWHEKAEHKFGDAWDNWYWSGDRSVSCSWDKPGKHFTCTATARPCYHGW